MSRGAGAHAEASTSRLPHSSLPAKPRTQGDFNQQDDFISFADLEDDEPRSYRGKGKGKEQFGGPRGKKRTIGEVLDEQGKRKLKDVEKTTPWTADVDWDSHASATQQLSAEIKAFTEYISPTDQEHELRTCVVESIRRLIVGRWRDATVHAFGSFETRLYLPTGDIDLVIISPSISREKNQMKRILFIISGLLKSANIGTDIIVIGKARVPIVKFVTVQGGFKVDISLNMTNGINVGKRVVQMFKEVGESPARALIMVTKAFLSQRNMNEVYSGGLGSYSIICLVISFLQLHPKLQRKEIDPYENLGTLLIEFLELYGKHFNFEDVGICVSSGGSYYSKHKRGWYRPNQPYLLSIEDPADPTNDVAGGSHNIKAVQMSLGGAFEVLTYAMYVRTSVIVARIAAAQSGRQLPTLSGRAIPQSVEGEDDELDECRKSLLGSILGVTTEIEKSRDRAQALAISGFVQRSIGQTPGVFDERGRLYDPSKPPKAAVVPTKVTEAPKGTQPLPSSAQPWAKPEKMSKRQKRKQAAIEAAAAAADNAPPAREPRLEVQVVESTAASAGSSRRPSPSRPAASTSRRVINLDSDSDSSPPSPPPELATKRSQPSSKPVAAALAAASTSDSADSRYAVKKGKAPAKNSDLQYQPNGVDDDDVSSGTDSDIILVENGKQTRGKPVRNESSNSNDTTKSSTAQCKGNNDKGKQPSRASRKARVTTSSDMEMSDSPTEEIEKAAPPSRPKRQVTLQSAASASRGKPTSPRNSSKIKQRQEYWKAKGKAVNKQDLSSDSDSSESDTVFVRSK